MPVILEQQDWPVWLGEAEGEYAALLRAAADGLLQVWPVDRRVGSPRNNGPELLESIAACLGNAERVLLCGSEGPTVRKRTVRIVNTD
jgi:hypothetical protein